MRAKRSATLDGIDNLTLDGRRSLIPGTAVRSAAVRLCPELAECRSANQVDLEVEGVVNGGVGDSAGASIVSAEFAAIVRLISARWGTGIVPVSPCALLAPSHYTDSFRPIRPTGETAFEASLWLVGPRAMWVREHGAL
jgi:hypothetical protein